VFQTQEVAAEVLGTHLWVMVVPVVQAWLSFDIFLEPLLPTITIQQPEVMKGRQIVTAQVVQLSLYQRQQKPISVFKVGTAMLQKLNLLVMVGHPIRQPKV
jgi:hypothetical protein